MDASSNGAVGTSTLTQRWSIPSAGGVTLTATAKLGDEKGFAYHAGTADALGSVQTVVTATHDGTLGQASKSSDDARSYDPWGTPRAETFGVGVPTFDAVNDGFTGHRAQHDGGLVDMNLRHYDPESRRFISPDPVVAGVYDTQAWNRYSYVRNNPLRRIDPTGAYGQSPYGSGNTLHQTYATGPAGVVAILAAAIASSAASGAIGNFFKSLGRRLRNRFKRSRGSRDSGAPSTATPPKSYASAEPSVLDEFEQAARTQAGKLRDAASAGIASVERAWDDPLGTVRNGVVGYYDSLSNAATGYGEYAVGHFSALGSGIWNLGGDLIDDPLGTGKRVATETVFGFVDNVSGVLQAEATTFDALGEYDLSGAAAAQWDVATNSYEGAGKAYTVGKGVSSASSLAQNGVKTAVSAARSGGGGGDYVYRGLSASDDIARGLQARAPGAGNSPIGHVAGKRASEWVSTTKDAATAVEKYGKHGVVKIDLSKVGSRVEDVSNGFLERRSHVELGAWRPRSSHPKQYPG